MVIHQVQVVEKVVEAPKTVMGPKIVELPNHMIQEAMMEVPRVQLAEGQQVVKQIALPVTVKVEVPVPTYEILEKIMEAPQIVHDKRIIKVPEHQVEEIIRQIHKPICSCGVLGFGQWGPRLLQFLFLQDVLCQW